MNERKDRMNERKDRNEWKKVCQGMKERILKG